LSAVVIVCSVVLVFVSLAAAIYFHDPRFYVSACCFVLVAVGMLATNAGLRRSTGQFPPEPRDRS
jgi:hypothetical protein